MTEPFVQLSAVALVPWVWMMDSCWGPAALWLCACTTHLSDHADVTSPSLLSHLNQNIPDIAWAETAAWTEISCWAHPSPGEEPTQSSWQSAMPGPAWEVYLHYSKDIVIYWKRIGSLRSEILQLLYRWEKRDWQKINRNALYWNKFSFLFFFYLLIRIKVGNTI